MSVNKYGQQVHHVKLMGCRSVGDCGGGTSAGHVDGVQAEVWVSNRGERCDGASAGSCRSAEGWAGVVFHSRWPLWTAACRLLNVSLFTLLTRDTLWTLDNCQQHSTPKTAQKRLLSCLARSFNGGSHTEMAYLHQTSQRGSKKRLTLGSNSHVAIWTLGLEFLYPKIKILCSVFVFVRRNDKQMTKSWF